MSQPYPAPQDPSTPGSVPTEPAPTGSYPLPTAPQQQQAAPVQAYESQPYTQPSTPAYPAQGYPAPSAPANPGYGYPAAAEPAYSTAAAWQQPGLVTDRREQSSAVIAIAWVCTVLTLGYMLPWAIAATRGRSNQATIGVLNLLLGWSLIGWVVTLVMACQAHTVYAAQQPTVVVAQQFGTPYQQQAPAYPAPAPAGPAAGWYPASDGQGQQYWDGTAWTGHRAP
ncbi:superinfection immunity protein [Cellulomonas hominis]